MQINRLCFCSVKPSSGRRLFDDGTSDAAASNNSTTDASNSTTDAEWWWARDVETVGTMETLETVGTVETFVKRPSPSTTDAQQQQQQQQQGPQQVWLYPRRRPIGALGVAAAASAALAAAVEGAEQGREADLERPMAANRDTLGRGCSWVIAGNASRSSVEDCARGSWGLLEQFSQFLLSPAALVRQAISGRSSTTATTPTIAPSILRTASACTTTRGG